MQTVDQNFILHDLGGYFKWTNHSAKISYTLIDALIYLFTNASLIHLFVQSCINAIHKIVNSWLLSYLDASIGEIILKVVKYFF